MNGWMDDGAGCGGWRRGMDGCINRHCGFSAVLIVWEDNSWVLIVWNEIDPHPDEMGTLSLLTQTQQFPHCVEPKTTRQTQSEFLLYHSAVLQIFCSAAYCISVRAFIVHLMICLLPDLAF